MPKPARLDRPAVADGKASWTFLTNHGHVLVCIMQDSEMRLAEMARLVGIGERAVHRIVQDLIEAGYISRHKAGRRNHYTVHLDRPLRHPLEAGHQLREVFEPLTPRPPTS
jgi:DNA-binding IclR family transcriptional regulator